MMSNAETKSYNEEEFLTPIKHKFSNKILKNQIPNSLSSDDFLVGDYESDKIINCEQCNLLMAKLSMFSEENSRLKTIIKDMNDLEKTRQYYDLEKQDYIQRLLKTIKMLQLRSSKLITSDNQTNSETLSDRKHAVVHICRDKLKNESEVLSSLQQSYEMAVKENVRLQKELDDTRNNFDTLVDKLETIENEHIQILTIQLKHHREDFEDERNEKLKALGEIKRLCNQIDKLNTKCTNYEMKLCFYKNIIENRFSISKETKVKQSSSHSRIHLPNSNKDDIIRKTQSLPTNYRHNSNVFNEIDKQNTVRKYSVPTKNFYTEFIKSNKDSECDGKNILNN